MRYAFRLVDVFTDRPLAGNQLAVVLDAEGLETVRMQAIAREFNFSEEIAGTGLPVQTVSTGLAYLMVPVRSLTAMRRLHPRPKELGAALALFPGAAAYCFTRAVEQAGSDAHCRMFAPHLGTAEDPATGSAAGPLACYLATYTEGDGVQRFRFEQGIEMGRPSVLEASVEQHGGAIRAVRVAGEARLLGEGWLTLEANP